MKQNKVPIIEALENYCQQTEANFHVPGHHQGKALLESMQQENIFRYDLTEVPGLDDLHHPQEAIKKAQDLAALAFGANSSYFLVNGTSGGLMALMMAVCQTGDEIIVPRNVHRSVINGLIISGGKPCYIYPPQLESFSIPTAITVQQLQGVLKKNFQPKAVLMVNPSYYGISANLKDYVTVTHSRNIPILIDEAHGGHFRFHPQLPQDALAAGCDAVVQSTHKVGGALTQASMLHLNSSLLQEEKVRACLSMIQTTSPSYILMASLDAARKQLVVKGAELLERSLRIGEDLRQKITTLSGIKVLVKEHLAVEEYLSLDESRLVINLRGLKIDGFQAYEILSRQGIMLEMADAENLVAVLGLMPGADEGEKLYQGLARLSQTYYTPGMEKEKGLAMPKTKLICSPRQAWQAETEYVPLLQGLGRISSETIAVYPPGIPVICPGEEISSDVIQYLLAVKKKKLHIQSTGDQTLVHLQVMKEK